MDIKLFLNYFFCKIFQKYFKYDKKNKSIGQIIIQISN